MKFQFFFSFFFLSRHPLRKKDALKALWDDSAWAVGFACRHLFIMPPPPPPHPPMTRSGEGETPPPSQNRHSCASLSVFSASRLCRQLSSHHPAAVAPSSQQMSAFPVFFPLPSLPSINLCSPLPLQRASLKQIRQWDSQN